MNVFPAFAEPLFIKGNIGWALVAGLSFFFLAHIAGRVLKRRTGVKFGVIYEVFALAVGALIGLQIYGKPLPAAIELISLAELTGAFVITALVNRFFWEIYFIRSGKPPAPKFFSQVFSLIVVVAAFILIISINFGQSKVINTVLTTGGVLALTVGLALQDLLGNIIAGFTIHFGQPFKAGDWLIIEEKHVEVMEINWRSTRCRTNDDTYLDVPNTSIIKQTVMNLYYPDRVHAIRIKIGLEYDTPPNLAKDCLLAAAQRAAGVLTDPAPRVFLLEYGDSSINYEIKAFINDHAAYPAIMDAIRTNIWYELKRHGLEIPFPQQVFKLDRTPSKVPEDFSSQVVELLKKQESFSFLTSLQLRHLTEGSRAVFFGRNETIIQQGDMGDSMFVMLSGSLRVLVEHEGASTQVAALKSGACFGEMSLLTGENRSATVIAEEDSLVVELQKASMSRVLKENSRVVEKLGELLAKRKLSNDQIAASSAQGKRVAMVRSLKASFLGRLKTFFEL